MRPALVALLIGLPLCFLLAAIVLMVWRAVHPERNLIRGLTDKWGRITNPHIYLGMAVFMLMLVAGSSWLAIANPRRDRNKALLGLAAGVLGFARNWEYYQRLRRTRRPRPF